MYQVTPLLPVDELDPGTNLLVRGPPISGKHRLVNALLDQGFERGDTGLVVSTKDGVSRVRDEHPKGAPLGVVDCVTAHAGGTLARESDTWGVGSPGDLTGIGIGVRELGDRSPPGSLRFVLDNISTLLAYTTAEQLYRFLHVLTNYMDSRNSLGLYIAHAGGVDQRDLNRFTSLFDGVIETRSTDDGFELRMTGVTVTPTDWVSSPIDAPTPGGEPEP